MASKRKCNIDDYQLTTTLGTGKLLRLSSGIERSARMNSCDSLEAFCLHYDFRFTNLIL